MSKARILIVDDEKNVVTALKFALEREGYQTLTVLNGTRALEVARREIPNLVLLDWMLPEIDGLEVCRRLREEEKTRAIPVILLTVRAEETDKVLGLEMGADDYVTKPFSQRELLARIKAALRRTSLPASIEVFRLGELQADWGKHLVTIRGEPVELTHKEFHLLKALVEARGRVLTREDLLDEVWGYDRASQIETRTVDLHISQLRRKLQPLAKRILTLKNVGYRLVIED
jgi:two-component system alkaline phosphatase synthesis response regulator PhoP